jgi:hypothetical protein
MISISQLIENFSPGAVALYYFSFIPATIAVGMLCTSPRPPVVALLSPM